MMTHTDTPAGRVTVWQTNFLPPLWMWMADGEGPPFGPFPTLAAAISDAQAARGAGVPITHHTEALPAKAQHEGEAREFGAMGEWG